MRRILLLLAAIGLLAGCGGGGGGGQEFTTDELPKLVLRPSEAPKGLEYAKSESGPNILEKAGSGQGLEPLKKNGLEGDYGIRFLSKGGATGPIFAEALALVFKDSSGASKALAFTKTQATQGGKTVSVSAKGLGIEGWALHGSFFNPKAPRTYFYTWRIGNAILSFILSGDVTEKQARGYSETLNRRAKDVARSS
ncbi:MAG TPA: hypothetical protein VF895_03385 [Gaiellaceae bacterium]